MKNLGGDEKSVLNLFLRAQSKTYKLPNHDATVLNLLRKGVLYSPFELGNIKKEMEFILEDWAWIYLKKNHKKMGIKYP